MFKKILLLVILAISVVGCELLSPKEWREYHERKAVLRGLMAFITARIDTETGDTSYM